MSTHNATLIRRWFEEVWNQRRVDAIDAMLAEDYVTHGLAMDGGDLSGPEGFKRFHAQFLGAFPDMHITIEAVVAEGDLTAARFSGTATHRGDHLGVAPTHKTVAFTGMTFARWRDGKIVEGWNNVDMLNLLKQVGAL